MHVARNAHEFVHRGVELVLIDPGKFWYSGLATGMLGGMYEPALDQIDAQRLIECAGGAFIADTAVGLDREKKLLCLASGATLRYALLSLNIGSEVALPRLNGQDHAALPAAFECGPRIWSVKPIANLWRLRQQLEQRFQPASKTASPHQIVVAGGGATGCEIALNIDALARKCGARIRLSLISRSARLISRQPRGAAKALAACLRQRGIELVAGSALQKIDADRLLAGGQSYRFDVLVLATGLKPARVIADMNLAAARGGIDEESDERSGMKVEPTLRWTADSAIFGAGDCIDFAGRELPKLGVFGVRQAPVLLHNLLAALDGLPLQDYEPQKNYLAILNLGCGDGLATWGPFYWRGRASLWWKDRIDRRFLARYQNGLEQRD
ncbi:MAG: FAD-dependent oxidoreductase [Pseudomonadota bacterium]|nr:FAD-dependent oxidoreductase [Pseudomonadota bacterium]